MSFAEIGVVQPRKFTTGWPRCRVTLIETFLSKMRDVGCNPASDLRGEVLSSSLDSLHDTESFVACRLNLSCCTDECTSADYNESNGNGKRLNFSVIEQSTALTVVK